MEKAKNVGRVVSVVGPVVDVRFEMGELPDIYDALVVRNPRTQTDLVLEVEQLLGDKTVRCVAMDSTDGLVRGLEVYDTGKPIQVPVGREVLGRLFNLLGEPIDEAGEVRAADYWPIHRDCLLYTSPSPRDRQKSRMPSSA